VAAIAAKQSPGLATFSIGFGSLEHDESGYAKQVADFIGSDHHHYLFDSERFVNLLPKVAAALDEPVGDQATLPLYWLCHEASQRIKVALSGEGADEVFAGYDYYRNFSTRPSLRMYLRFLLKRQIKALELVRLINNSSASSPSGFPLLTDFAGRAALLEEPANDALDDWEESLITWLDSATNPLQRASAADLETWLPDDLLIKFDRMAMAHSLEGRAPYLTPSLVDAALHLPDEERMTNAKSKVALRRIARQWLPPNILARRKQGFVLPMKRWITEWFALHGGVAAYLANHPIPGLNASRVMSLIDEDLSAGVQRERLLFALLLLFEWYSAAQVRIGALRKAYLASRNCVH